MDHLKLQRKRYGWVIPSRALKPLVAVLPEGLASWEQSSWATLLAKFQVIVITKVLEFSLGLSKRKFARDCAQFLLAGDVIRLQLLFLSNLLRWSLTLPSQQQVFRFVQVAACLTILLIDSRLLQLPSLHVLVAP